MQDYARHAPTPAEPWWEGVTPADRIRYDRALRLSQFALGLVAGRYQAKVEGGAIVTAAWQESEPF